MIVPLYTVAISDILFTVQKGGLHGRPCFERPPITALFWAYAKQCERAPDVF